MELLYAKSCWEVLDLPLGAFLARTRQAGFDGAEFYPMYYDATTETVATLLERHGLFQVSAVFTEGSTPEEHAASLSQRFEALVDYRPVLLNLHIGRDIFAFDDNAALINNAIELGRKHEIPVVFETHRARATYNAIDTRRYLEAIPAMRLNADLSHWMVVHASDLRDQMGNVALALSRSDYIHARVGYEHGAQITDPRAPEWQQHVDNHIALWQVVVEHHKQADTRLIITPEFGPPPYAPTIPLTQQPVTDIWQANVHMLAVLKNRLNL